MDSEKLSFDSFRVVMGEIMGFEPSQLHENMNIQEEFGIDSLGLVSLGNKIEKHYKIEVEAAQMVTIQTVGQFYRYVEKKVSEAGA